MVKFYHICIVPGFFFNIWEFIDMIYLYLYHQVLQCLFLENKHIYQNQEINIV